MGIQLADDEARPHTGCCSYWAWFKIVSRASAVVSSLGTLLIPVVGVMSSMLVLGERPSWQEFAAMVLVLAAIATVLVPAPSRTAG